MNKFGIPDSVINSVNAVLEAGTKMPRQLKDPKKETMMGFEYKPGKVRNQVVDKKDVKDKEKKGYIHTENIAIESLEIAKLIEDYQLNEYFDKEHVGSSKNYHVHSTNPEEGEYSLTHKKTGKKTTINVSDNYPMNRTKHVKKDIKGKVPGSDHHSVAKKINQHLQGGRPAGTYLDQDGRDHHTANVRRDLRKQGVKRSDAMEAFEDDIAEAMEMHLKPHGTAGTHYTVHKVGKKLAKHGGIKVGEKLSDTQVDDARDSGVKVRHVKEDAELEESGMGRVAYQKQSGEPGSGLQTFKKRDEKKHGGVVSKKLDPVDSKALMGRLAQRKDKDIDNDGDVDNSDSYLHNRRKTVKTAIKADRTPNYKTKVKKAMKEGVGDEKVRSSAQAAQLAKHYYAKAKAAQASGSKEEAAKMMSAAKTFYRKSESDQAQEKGGRQVAKAESTENVGIGEYYFNELEIEEIEAAEDIVTEEKRKNSGAKVGETERSGHRVTKTEKEGPEHIVMQARKVVSLGKNHAGVEFGDGSKAKVDPKHASAALNRYNQAKPAEKEHMQSTMNHSHDGLKHVASGKAMDHPDNPHKPKANKLSGSDRRTDRAVSLMRHPDDED